MNSFTQHPKLGAALALEPLYEGRVWRVFLDRPKANVIDAEMIAGLDALFTCAAHEPKLKLVTLEGRGDHFSFGASVEEHMPGQCGAMLRSLHGMLVRLHEAHVPVHAVVRGYCLGAGLELAAFAHRIFACPKATLGQPEIQLGVFAPVATAILEGRVGRGAAEDLCLSGRNMDAAEAFRVGLVDDLEEDPWAACAAYYEAHLAPRSASSLRLAVRALRAEFGCRFRQRIADLEQLYLGELMSTHDAVEGLTAFLEKRQPVWTDA
ncbi:MAG: cyclohexa-1,5-dienecarbonyl-CoA hydratase [Planctomycetes bacterium]|nr:cyclohexa-1,5-dienecarbonyl-CoA hydratase [Planctomycetota bacterium]